MISNVPKILSCLFMFKYPKAEQNKIKAIIMSNYYKENKKKDSKTFLK